jgi:hypothetical protein
MEYPRPAPRCALVPRSAACMLLTHSFSGILWMSRTSERKMEQQLDQNNAPLEITVFHQIINIIH